MPTFGRQLATIASTLVLAMTGVPAAQASFAGGNGVIAYSATGGLWAVEPLTGDQRQLTTVPGDTFPSFSPSGDMLAFQRSVHHKTYIYLAKADGSSAHMLTGGREPTFSPTGGRLVFADGSGLAVTGLGPGGKPRQLTHNPHDRLPRWSARNQIVFERGRGLYVFAFSRPSPSLVLSFGSEGRRFADWSPDGSTLAVAACVHDLFHPIVEDLPTSPPILLHGSCDPVVWAPSGHKVAELDSGALAGREFTLCPQRPIVGPLPFASAMEASAIAWQPLHGTSEQVQTLPCPVVYEPGYQMLPRCPLFEACQGGGPEHGTAVCWKRHGLTKCVKVA